MTPSTYQKTIIISVDDLDELNHVNNIRYLQWVQDISKEHWLNQVDQKTKNELLWVVRNHNITYYDSAVLGDTLHLLTEIIAWKGPISVRQVVMKNEQTNKIIIKATTEWCALNSKTMKPIRVPEKIKNFFKS